MWMPLRFSATALLLALVPRPSPATPLELVNGEPAAIEGSTSFTFWMKEEVPGLRQWRYRRVPAGTENRMLEGAVVDLPPGIEIVQKRLGVRAEETSHRDANRTFKFEQYVVSGEWTVTAARDRPAGAAAIQVRFPAALEVRNALGASSPEQSPVITLPVVTFENALARAGASAGIHIRDALLLMALMTIALAGSMTALLHLFRGTSPRLFFVVVALLLGAWWLAGEMAAELGLGLQYAWTMGTLLGLASIVLLNALVYGVVWLLAGLGRWTAAREMALWGGIVVLVGFSAAQVMRASRPMPPLQILYATVALLPALFVSSVVARLRVARDTPRADGPPAITPA
jgi:hypothetical protein